MKQQRPSQIFILRQPQGALVKAERAEETITFVSTDGLTPGIYFMVVKGADYTETVKVIVK